MACAMFGLECRIFMVRISYDQKPYRRMMMATWGAECIPSPSDRTQAGKKILAEDPNSPGSLGIAISEAIEDAVGGKDSRYSLGSVLNHVLLHQTIIGLEAQKQLAKIGEYPDVVMGCAGGAVISPASACPSYATRSTVKTSPLWAPNPHPAPR